LATCQADPHTQPHGKLATNKDTLSAPLTCASSGIRNISSIRLLAGQSQGCECVRVVVKKAVLPTALPGCHRLQPPDPREHHPPPSQEANDESFSEAAHWLQDDRRQDDQSPITTGLVRTILSRPFAGREARHPGPQPETPSRLPIS